MTKDIDELDRCVWLDMACTVSDDDANKLIAYLLRRTRSHEKHKNVDKHKEKQAMTVVVANLLRLNSQKHLKYLTYSRSNNQHKLNQYNPQKFGKTPLLNVINGLLDCEFVYPRGSFHDRGRESRGYWARLLPSKKLKRAITDFYATHAPIKFLATEIIILKDEDKNQIDYPETPDTILMRKDLERYNDRLSKADITLDPNIRIVKRGLKDTTADFTCTRYRRVFNRGSFELGGRFYGPWWQSIKNRKNLKLRSHIKINGHSTKEVDYSGYHLSLIYALDGQDPSVVFADDDPYALEGYDRRIVKTVFFVAVNAKDWVSGIQAIKKELRDNKVPYKDVDFDQLRDDLFKKRPLARTYLFNDQGLELQYLDSQIMERVIQKLLDLNITPLSIHDSVIVEAKHVSTVEGIMKSAFKAHGLTGTALVTVE